MWWWFQRPNLKTNKSWNGQIGFNSQYFQSLQLNILCLYTWRPCKLEEIIQWAKLHKPINLKLCFDLTSWGAEKSNSDLLKRVICLCHNQLKIRHFSFLKNLVTKLVVCATDDATTFKMKKKLKWKMDFFRFKQNWDLYLLKDTILSNISLLR